MAAGTGLVIPGGDHRAPAPTSARKIRDAYDEAAAALLAAVVESWTDTALQIEDMMYGESRHPDIGVQSSWFCGVAFSGGADQYLSGSMRRG
jgi:hypothetical protein